MICPTCMQKVQGEQGQTGLTWHNLGTIIAYSSGMSITLDINSPYISIGFTNKLSAQLIDDLSPMAFSMPNSLALFIQVNNTDPSLTTITLSVQLYEAIIPIGNFTAISKSNINFNIPYNSEPIIINDIIDINHPVSAQTRILLVYSISGPDAITLITSANIL